jgi:hypothetical protein
MKNAKNSEPSTAVNNGRNADGSFAQGNRFGTGNPFAKKVAQLRSMLLSEIKPADIRKIIRLLIDKAKKGDIIAAKEVLDRAIGKSVEADLLQRLEDLENLIAEKENGL